MNLPEKVRRAIEVFLRNLRLRYPDAEAYLYGSYARGDWLLDSDVDLIVVSDLFDEQNMAKRIAEVRRLAPRDVAFEIIAYTRREFEEAKRRSITVQDAATYWKKLLNKPPERKRC